MARLFVALVIVGVLLAACGDAAPVPIPPGVPAAAGQVIVTPPVPSLGPPETPELSVTEQLFVTATAQVVARLTARANAPVATQTAVPVATVPPSRTTVPSTPVPATAAAQAATPRPAPPTPRPPRPTRQPATPRPTAVAVDDIARKRLVLQCQYELQQAAKAIAAQQRLVAEEQLYAGHGGGQASLDAEVRLPDDMAALTVLQLDQEYTTRSCALETAANPPADLANRLAALSCTYSLKEQDAQIAAAQENIRRDTALGVNRFGDAGAGARQRLPGEQQRLQDLQDQRAYMVAQCNL